MPYKDRAKRIEYMRQWRKAQKEKGCCQRCQADITKGKTICRNCLKGRTKYKETLHERGICKRCHGRMPDGWGRKHCIVCIEVATEEAGIRRGLQ